MRNCESYHVVMAADDAYAQHVGVCLVSLFSNNRNIHFQITVFENGISSENKEKIYEVAKCFSQTLRFITLKVEDFSDYPITSYYSPVTYFRLRLADYIDTAVSRILYLDCDTIVCGDLQPLFEIDMLGHSIAAVMDTPWQVEYSTGMFGLPISSGYFNAGVMLIDMNEYRNADVFKCSLKIIEEREQLPYLDQDILNLIFVGKWLQLPCKWNMLNGFFRRAYHDGSERSVEMKEGIADRCVIHFSSPAKPWGPSCIHPLRDEYYRYLNDSPWKGFSPNRNCKQLFSAYSERFKEIFNKGEYMLIK